VPLLDTLSFQTLLVFFEFLELDKLAFGGTILLLNLLLLHQLLELHLLAQGIDQVALDVLEGLLDLDGGVNVGVAYVLFLVLERLELLQN